MRICSLWLVWFAFIPLLRSQTYFKVFEKPARSYDKRIALFRNGDILIGGDAAQGPGNTGGRKMFLLRIDKCGAPVWQKQYDWKGNYMEFRDFVLSESGEIFVLGSAYEGIEEYIFLLRTNAQGEVLHFQLYQGSPVDNFSYSIGLQDRRVVISGLLKDWLIQKRGFVATFDEKLNFLHGTAFDPFETRGSTCFTRDGGALCRAGPYLVKLQANGNLQWAGAIETNTETHPIAGPWETDQGYLFQHYAAGYSFFFTLDREGQLLWKSLRFPSAQNPADVEVLDDGAMLVVYPVKDQGLEYPCRLLLAANGDILQQQKLSAGQPFQTGFIDHVSGKNKVVQAVGNFDPFIIEPGESSDFLLQYDLNEGANCFVWEDFRQQMPNDVHLTLKPEPIHFYPLLLTQEVAPLSAQQFDAIFKDICLDTNTPRIIPRDTLLPCAGVWTVPLPGPDFIWDDGYPGNPRLLMKAGAYRASSTHCGPPLTYEYRLEKEPCACPVYLPNAFYPDAAGYNDRLQLSGDCTLSELNMQVYSRWGEKVFETRAPDGYWNGDFKGKPALPGVYLVTLRYRLLDIDGQLHEGALTRDVLLMR